MQEFVKKLIAELENEKTRMEQMYIDNLSRPDTNLTLRLDGKVQGIEKAIYIANKLAEEYTQTIDAELVEKFGQKTNI